MKKQKRIAHPRTMTQVGGCIALFGVWFGGILIGLSVKYEPRRLK